MRYKKLGKTQIEISEIGLGTWAIGGGPWWGSSDEKQSIQAIEASIDCGINLIDTAPAYGFGYSEEVVGKAIHGKRDKIVLSTKCGLWWQDEQNNFAFEFDGRKVYKSLKAETIKKELEISLKRMNTDYIDIYHTHWPDVTTDIEETALCLRSLQKEGKIRAIAVSNANIEECKQYITRCELSSNQLKYSMLDRSCENGMTDFCCENEISILAYSPLEQGLLTGKIGIDTKFTDTQYRNSIPWYRPSNRINVLNMLEKWQPLTEKYSCTLVQLVIAWTAAQKGITSVLCGARNIQHATENAAAMIDLSAEDIDIIKKDILMLGEAHD